MLTPKKIQDLADPVEEIYMHMSDELLINIGKHVRAPTWTHTAVWEVQKLAELGQLTEENAAIINKWIAEIPAAARQTMENTRAEALAGLEKQLAEAVENGTLPAPAADSTAQVLSDMLAQAQERYNLVNGNMLNSSVEMYQQAILNTAQTVREAEARQLLLMQQAEATQGILNEAAASVAAGTKTHRAAVRDAIRDISARGLTGFVDRAGRSWTPEAYINMVTRTTVHNTAIQSRRAFAQDYGSSVFQASSHAGARPGCYPYQGKFYSWDNSAGEIELGDGRRVRYEPISSTTYGQPAGLFGVNCGHSPIPIVPGVTIPHGEDAIQPREENERVYAESQEQRQLERNIRAAKREVAMLGDLATKEDRARVRAAQADMRAFIGRTGRTRRPTREQI